MAEAMTIQEFRLEEDELKDALNYARGHIVRGDIEAALNSVADAQNVLDRIEQRLEQCK